MEWSHQNGWDITQNIFHVEWVESTWNDMDSIWIPCGMWGESKDLKITLDMSAYESDNEIKIGII